MNSFGILFKSIQPDDASSLLYEAIYAEIKSLALISNSVIDFSPEQNHTRAGQGIEQSKET